MTIKMRGGSRRENRRGEISISKLEKNGKRARVFEKKQGP